MARGLAHLLRQRADGETVRAVASPCVGARGVGRLHRGAQRQRVDGTAVLGERLDVRQAEGDQRAARGGRWIERHARSLVPPIKRLAQLDAVMLEIVIGEMATEIARLRPRWPARHRHRRKSRAPSSASHSRHSASSALRKVSPADIGLPFGAKIFATPSLAVRIGAMTVKR